MNKLYSAKDIPNATKDMPKFIFFDINKDIVDGYEQILKHHIIGSQFIATDVDTLINNYKMDAIVSPANSYGFMTGGIDRALNKTFNKIDIKLRQTIESFKIDTCPRGQYILPVGMCLTIPTNHPRCPLMLSVPTMLFPASIVNSDNVYKAFKAILSAYGNKNIIISCCGLGTLTGNMTGTTSAYQILRAYQDYYNNGA